MKIDTSTFDSETKASLLRVSPRMQDPWVISAEPTLSKGGQPGTLICYHSRGSYSATIPLLIADKVITGRVTDDGKLYGVKWKGSSINKDISRYMRPFFRESKPAPPPHFEIRFGNNRVRSLYEREFPIREGQPMPVIRSIGHDFAGKPCIAVLLYC